MDDQTQPPQGGTPAAKIVKGAKTAPPPEIINLQKKVSSLENRVGGVEGALDGVNKFLEGLGTGKPGPAPNAQPGIFNEINEFLSGKS